MSNNQQQEQSKPTKTYISETNQNRPDDTLPAEENAIPVAKADPSDKPATSQASDQKHGEAIMPPHGDTEEPEVLSAETDQWEPVAGVGRAEEVAGLPVGSIYPPEGELQSKEAEEQGESDLPSEEVPRSPS